MWDFLIQMDFSSHSCTYRLSLYNRSAWADVSLFHIFKGEKKNPASGYRGASTKLINNHSEFPTESRSSFDGTCVCTDACLVALIQPCSAAQSSI